MPDKSFNTQVPDGDNRPREVCDHCGWIHYDNPKVVVGAVCLLGDRILLCKRAIEPRTGFWTIPSGFLEQGESVEDGTLREAREEAGVELEIDHLLAVYDIPRISQVQLVYLARLVTPAYAAGEESLEVELFDYESIPWRELAFPANHWALIHYGEVREQAAFTPFRRTIDSMEDLP